MEYNNIRLEEDEIIFGLDIGTRTVIGIVGYQKGDNFIIIANEIIEHEPRAMIDGQIHDISKVAKVVTQVKTNLENKLGFELKRVAIAAAGRTLKTYLVNVENSIDDQEIALNNIKALELDGVTEAEEKLKEELQDENIKYFCVGHSIVNYYLDGYVIANLEGHKGNLISADVLATFLPQAVINSLYTVMARANLEVVTLTLEPIAAINVAIPEKLRLLNLALVDVGAGTSDIAITKDGSVIAYSMIPVAGDEITEQIMHNYLVDFETAEKIKIKLGEKEELSFEDIMGMPHIARKEDVNKIISPIVERLSSEVAQRIKEINGDKSPNAVFCVGGGSQINGFTEKLAEKLNLTKERVATRGSEIIENIIPQEQILQGPNVITPIGICITSILQRGYDFITVFLNGESIKLLNTKKLKIIDASIVKEFNHENLLGRKGKNLTFTLNGELKNLYGKPATQAEIYLNNKPADLETVIQENDYIIIKPAYNGKNAEAYVNDFISQENYLNITLNNIDLKLGSIVTINNNIVSLDTKIQNDDIVKISMIDSIEELCKLNELSLENKVIYINNIKVDIDAKIQQNDRIDIKDISNEIEINNIDNEIEINNIENEKELTKDIRIQNISDKTIDLTNNAKQILNKNIINVVVNGKNVVIDGNKEKYIFIDIFNFVNIDLKNQKGNINLILNKRKASFVDSIEDGDIIEIYWD